MKKICFIAQFPPPIHGLSKAVQTLYDSKIDNDMIFEKIDIKNNKLFLINMFKLIKSNDDLYYFTISQTKGGNIRDLIILKILDLKKKKYVIHLHGGSFLRKVIDNDMSKFQRNLNYKLISKAEKVIVLSDSLKPTFKGIVDDDKIVVIPNCVDYEFLLSKEEFEKKVNKIENKNVKDVLYLSNFIKEKGYEYVLELAKIEKKEFEATGKRKFRFNFAGNFFSDKDKKDFLDYIKENKLKDFVIYHGVVNGKEKKDLLKKSDVLILLTTYFREGQPISIIEAMGNGLAIIATDHTAIPDMMKDDVNGILVDKNNIDVNSIYEKMKCIEYKNVSKNNYEESKNYDEKIYLNNCINCFKDCF